MSEDETGVSMIPYFAHEGEMARMERMVRRMWAVIILLILLLAGSNAAWVMYENQFQDVEVTQEVEQEASGDGSNQFVGGDFYGSES